MLKTKCERIMDVLNTMKPIRNKKVRKEFGDIYGQIFSICEGEGLAVEDKEAGRAGRLRAWALNEPDKCPECGGPATHPSGLCRDCHQGKLEAEEVRLCDNLLAPELYGAPCENNLLCRDCPKLKEANP